MRIHLATFAGLGAFCVSGAALAGPFAAGDILASFNAITVGNYTSQHDAEGRLVIGGNLTGGTAQFNTRSLAPGAAFTGYGDANVYGNANGARYNANNQTVDIAGTASGATFSGAKKVNTLYAFPHPFNDFSTPLTNLSTQLAGLSGSTLSSLPLNNAVITAPAPTVDGGKVSVIHTTTAVLQSAASFSVDPGSAGLVVIDVAGNFTGHPNLQNGAAWRGKVLWNFTNATSLAFGSTGWEGSVLAPNADVTNNNPIEGALFAKSFTGGGELHDYALTGDLGYLTSLGLIGPTTGGGTGGGTTGVAEPASMLLIAAGLGALGMVRRRIARPG